jgi:hypothetical protein
MCFAVVFLFGICWFPIQLYTNILRPYIDKIMDEKYVPHVYFTFHLMAMSNSCLNPVIYGVMSSKFRAGYLHYWQYFISCCRLSNNRSRTKDHPVDNTSITPTFRIDRRTYGLNLKAHNIECDRTSNTSVPCSIPLLSSQRVSSNN